MGCGKDRYLGISRTNSELASTDWVRTRTPSDSQNGTQKDEGQPEFMVFADSSVHHGQYAPLCGILLGAAGPAYGRRVQHVCVYAWIGCLSACNNAGNACLFKADTHASRGHPLQYLK
jgi:hypothetical protein